MPLFDRFATVTIGRPPSGILIDGLRVKFQIEKTIRGALNKGIVTIWNMKESSRNAIRAQQDVMILSAGYHDDEKQSRLAIQMDIVDVRVEVQKPEIVTAMTVVDGVNALRTNKLSISFAGGVGVKSVIRDLAGKAGLVVRDLAVIDDAQYQQGFADSGPIGDILDRLSGKVDANWSFQNGELQFAPKDAPATNFVSVVNEKTGLIGHPVKRTKAGDITAPFQRQGWIFKTFLNPTIEPNGRVRIESLEANGIYRVVTVKHDGDTWEGEFTSSVEAEEWLTT